MYINWFTWILFFDDPLCYMKIGGKDNLQFYHNNVILPLTRLKQGTDLVIFIYTAGEGPKSSTLSVNIFILRKLSQDVPSKGYNYYS